jgi:demethylmenaquinone methyltransferase/2-methoxy-6-polyprenyl-1,4-benzoquinol methylase
VANSFFDPGEQRAEKVKALFTQISARYDLMNDVQSFGLHRYWKRHLVRLAKGRPGSRALDLCCGTGDIALALKRRGAQVAGLDFSVRMLEEANHKANADHRPSRRQDPGPRYLCGDALRVPFADNTFDIVTVGYGLRNLPSWEAGLREMQRVAKPGGRLLALEFGKPSQPLWRSIYFGYLRWVVPSMGRVFTGSREAYSYILESLTHYPDQQEVASRMRALGLVEVRVIDHLGGVMSINYGEKKREK